MLYPWHLGAKKLELKRQVQGTCCLALVARGTIATVTKESFTSEEGIPEHAAPRAQWWPGCYQTLPRLLNKEE